MLTRIRQVRLVAADDVGNLLFAFSELLHIVGHDGLGACGVHLWGRG